MENILADLGPFVLLSAAAFAALAGAVKGIVGFAMPMVMISGLSTLMAPDLALAALILPTLLTNGVQALRGGWRDAFASVRRFALFLSVGGAALLASAQLVAVMPTDILLLCIGLPVTLFAVAQIGGWKPVFRPSRRLEAGIGAFAGAIGGVSGVWGPPTVTYLTAIGTDKTEQMRVQGVIYGLGAVLLLLAHVQSGIFSPKTAPLSALMVLPALLGMWLGLKISDRVDQAAFKRLTLIVLIVAGLNLIRRGLVG